MPEIRAVVFDLGNTLWFYPDTLPWDEFDGLQARAVEPLLARWNVTLPVAVAQVAREIREGGMAEWKAEWDAKTYREPPLPDTIRRILADYGVALSVAQSEEWWRTAWVTPDGLHQLYPDTIDVLSELRGRGVLVGINSNRPCTTAMMMNDLAIVGIAPYVDAAVCSGEVGFCKPHPATFEAIVRELGVAADSCVMVGDSCEADMRGAKALGLRTVLKLNGRFGVQPCDAVDFAIHDLHEIFALPWFDGPARLAASAESPFPHDDDNEGRY